MYQEVTFTANVMPHLLRKICFYEIHLSHTLQQNLTDTKSQHLRNFNNTNGITLACKRLHRIVTAKILTKYSVSVFPVIQLLTFSVNVSKIGKL